MADSKTKPANTDLHKFFNFKRVSSVTGIQPDKLYNKLNKKYNSWGEDDKKKIADALTPAVMELFEGLGYNVTIVKV